VITCRAFNTIQSGRYYVALSLVEAEALRGILHLRQDRTLVDGASTSVALRLTNGMLLDASGGYFAARPYHQAMAEQVLVSNRSWAVRWRLSLVVRVQAYRFLDCDVDFNEKQITLLLRCLQVNDCAARVTWFSDVRACRRRRQVSWRAAQELRWPYGDGAFAQMDLGRTKLSRFFTTPDEYAILQPRAAIARVAGLIRAKGMYPRDAFRAFNYR
jgi:hypothetical protein